MDATADLDAAGVLAVRLLDVVVQVEHHPPLGEISAQHNTTGVCPRSGIAEEGEVDLSGTGDQRTAVDTIPAG